MGINGNKAAAIETIDKYARNGHSLITIWLLGELETLNGNGNGKLVLVSYTTLYPLSKSRKVLTTI